MYQQLHQQLAHQHVRRLQPEGVRRRSLQVALQGRRQERSRLER